VHRQSTKGLGKKGTGLEFRESKEVAVWLACCVWRRSWELHPSRTFLV